MKIFCLLPMLAFVAIAAATESFRPSHNVSSLNKAPVAVNPADPDTDPAKASRVPEPNAASLIGAFGLLALLRRRRK